MAAWYVKTAPASGSEGNQAGTLNLRTTVEGVALRRSPLVADHTLIKRLPNASIVVALESGAASKIGVNGEWLKVRDANGVEGYLAAWYVEKT